MYWLRCCRGADVSTGQIRGGFCISIEILAEWQIVLSPFDGRVCTKSLNKFFTWWLHHWRYYCGLQGSLSGLKTSMELFGAGLADAPCLTPQRSRNRIMNLLACVAESGDA